MDAAGRGGRSGRRTATASRLVRCPAPSACSAPPCSSPSRSSRRSRASRTAAAPRRSPSRTPVPIARFGLPVAKLLVNLGAAGMIGALVLAVWALSPEAARVRRRPRRRRGIRRRAGRSRAPRPASSPSSSSPASRSTFDDAFGQKLGQFLTSIELGQAWLTTTLVAAAVTVLCFAVRNHTALVFVTVLAVASLVPMAQQGHAGGRRGPRRRDRLARAAPRVRARLARRAAHDRAAARRARRRSPRRRARAILDDRPDLLHRGGALGVRQRRAPHRHVGPARHARTACSCSPRSPR